MLGLLLLYFVGKHFSDLAQKYGKNKWLYAILAIVVYYGTTIVFGFLYGLIAALTNNLSMLEIPDLVIGLMVLPFGLLALWLMSRYLNKKWSADIKVKNVDLLDDI